MYNSRCFPASPERGVDRICDREANHNRSATRASPDQSCPTPFLELTCFSGGQRHQLQYWYLARRLPRRLMAVYNIYHSLTSPPGPMNPGLIQALAPFDNLLTCSSSTSIPSPGPFIKSMKPPVTFQISGL